MSSRSSFATLFAASLLTGCAAQVAQRERGFCGESFCLSSVATDQVQVSSPVEDFTLYRVSMGARTFVIYEGTQPMPPGRRVRSIRTNIRGARATLYRHDRASEVRIDRGVLRRRFLLLGEPTPPPQYIVATTACPSAGDCGIVGFSRLIVPR
jgi:hypothetical protein